MSEWRWPLAWAQTVERLQRRLASEELNAESFRLMWTNAKDTARSYEMAYRTVKEREWATQKAQEAAKSAQEALEKSEVRATQLEAQNAALRGALLALGGAVIEVSQ